MPDEPIGLSTSGPPETILETAPGDARTALAADLEGPEAGRKDALAGVVARFPRWSEAWAELGDRSEGVEAYAYYRVGYHRGLDHLRASGWRGSGDVRWRHEGNRGFLRALEGLRRLADEIGETDEAQRCAEFLRALDPDRTARG